MFMEQLLVGLFVYSARRDSQSSFTQLLLAAILHFGRHPSPQKEVVSWTKLATMACTATLKRSVELEALHSPQSPKRRRCSNLPGTPVSPSPKRCNLLSATGDNSSMSPQSTCGGEHRLTPEQIVQNLRQEYSRYQRRRKLEGAFNQSQSQSLSDGPGQSPGVMAPSAQPGVFSCTCK
ncbi:unnamed protein product [Oncorhynchus mykiss]|uniref:Uncharacterized protein n=1 Tax=Oncorhynchus mykiss TaxID=8022 RepID=A0A060YB96_ONCMY|nr:unnamed protein product [Oncorhynchus mykiss]